MSSYELKPGGIVFEGKMELKEWMELGDTLVGIERGRMFWIGDWVNYGESVFGEKYSQALSSTDYALSTLQKAASVCRRVPYNLRRPELSFEQHSICAQLEAKDLKKMLTKAADDHQTVKETRYAVDLLKGKNPPAKLEFTDWMAQFEVDEFEEALQEREMLTMKTSSFRDRMAKAWQAGQVNK